MPHKPSDDSAYTEEMKWDHIKRALSNSMDRPRFSAYFLIELLEDIQDRLDNLELKSAAKPVVKQEAVKQEAVKKVAVKATVKKKVKAPTPPSSPGFN